MSLEEFIDMLRKQETDLYNECIKAIINAYENADKEQLKNDPWTFWRKVDEICADYDVREAFRKEYLGEKNYSHIDKDIEEHLTKLSKSITKITGNVNTIEQINDTDYLVKGSKADMTIKLTPAKLSSSKNVMKSKIKALDVKEHEEELIEKEPSQFEESEYVKEWKARELEGYKEALRRWKDKLAEYEKAEEKITRKIKNLRINNASPDEINKAVEERKSIEIGYYNYKNQNTFFRDYGFSKQFEEMAKKMIDKHFDELQAKVEKKIGRIIKIESFGGDDYAFNGEKGDCVVEVVWAGGYNIQRLHTRWIVKNWNIDEY